MEEKFSVSLELMIQKFKDNAKKVQEVAQNVGNKIKENMSVNVGGGAFKEMTAESELLLNKINDIKATLSTQNVGTFKLTKQETLELRAELEKLEAQYNKLNQKSNIFSASFNKIQDGMNKSLKSAKRFTLSLFGIQSVYRLLSRASSAYLAQDTETSSKIQSAWIGLGSVFAPLLEKIANFVIKAVKYINVFIKALTGTDFLANAMAKSMDKANKSAGKLSKTLAGFDEITNLDDNAGGASVDTSWIDAFKNVELDPTLVQKMTDLGLAVKKVWDKYFSPFFNFLKDNWDLVGKDVVGLGLLIGIVVDAFTGNWIGLIVKLVGFIALYWDDIKAIFKLGIDIIWGIIVSLWEMIKGVFGLSVSLIKTTMTMIQGLITVPIEFIKNAFWSIADSVKGVVNGIKTIFSGLIDFITGVFTGNWKKAWEGVKKIFKGVFDTLWSIVKFPINLIIGGINALISGLNKISFKVPDWVPKFGGQTWGIKIPKIPKLDVGTNYVPNDTLAVVHKGESVVPKKFNSDDYVRRSDYNNNAKVESLLEELIDRVEQIEINPYTTIKDVGSASVSYINSQKRIKGRGVI
jgi:hypothetical protein